MTVHDFLLKLADLKEPFDDAIKTWVKVMLQVTGPLGLAALGGAVFMYVYMLYKQEAELRRYHQWRQTWNQ